MIMFNEIDQLPMMYTLQDIQDMEDELHQLKSKVERLEIELETSEMKADILNEEISRNIEIISHLRRSS